MSFNMVVLVKQVPDTSNIVEDAMKPDGTVNREALPAIINPEDLCALEEALKIKENAGGSITVISMGPPKAEDVLKYCLCMGADKAILLSDRRFAASDTLATSYTLTKAIEKLPSFDIIFCGRQAIDGDTAQVGPQVAEKLNINQLTYVFNIVELTKEYIVVKRDIGDGYEICKSPLPVLLTISSKANTPRPPSVKRAMAYKKLKAQKNDNALILLWDLESIGADPNRCGLKGSKTRVKKVENVVLKTFDKKEIQPTLDSISELLKELKEDHIIG